jgi:hypothetical protein
MLLRNPKAVSLLLPATISERTYIFCISYPVDLKSQEVGYGISLWFSKALVHLNEADEKLHVDV